MRSPELGSQNVSFEPPGNHSLFQLPSEAFHGKLTCVLELWGDNWKVPQVTGACEINNEVQVIA